jgi:hypothetical protein
MIPIGWVASALKPAVAVYRLVVKGDLRNRSEQASRNADTAVVVRSALTKLRWYEWPAARELQREGHGTIEGHCYRAWVNVTPPGMLMAMAMRGH